MSTALLTPPRARQRNHHPQRWPFQAGDRMDQATFHALSDQLPDGVRAELIEGIVVMPPSVSDDHSAFHGDTAGTTAIYKMLTPGVVVNDNPTVVLGPGSEPQPDLSLRVTAECGGQTRVVDGFVTGAPELVIEISASTETTDLGAKKRDYEQAGVREYVVVLVQRREVVWFEQVDGAFAERGPDADGIYRSRQFPGFWLDPVALLERDGPRLLTVLQQGIASPEHAAFVADLAARRLRDVGAGSSLSSSSPPECSQG